MKKILTLALLLLAFGSANSQQVASRAKAMRMMSFSRPEYQIKDIKVYADTMTESMEKAISETERRREIQKAYNEAHGITPQTIQKSVRELISISKDIAKKEMQFKKNPEEMDKKELEKLIADIQKKMQKAAAELNFEAAAEYRDKMVELKNMLRDL